MARGKVETYFVHHDDEGPLHQQADSVGEEYGAYVFRLGGEVVLHLKKESVNTLRILSDEEIKEIENVEN